MVHLSEVQRILSLSVLGCTTGDWFMNFLFGVVVPSLLCEPEGSELRNKDGTGRSSQTNGKDGHVEHLVSHDFVLFIAEGDGSGFRHATEGGLDSSFGDPAERNERFLLDGVLGLEASAERANPSKTKPDHDDNNAPADIAR